MSSSDGIDLALVLPAGDGAVRIEHARGDLQAAFGDTLRPQDHGDAGQPCGIRHRGPRALEERGIGRRRVLARPSIAGDEALGKADDHRASTAGFSDCGCREADGVVRRLRNTDVCESDADVGDERPPLRSLRYTILSPVLQKPAGGIRSSIVALWVAPLAFYLLAFCLLTYPLILSFPSHFFADAGDGLQNVWNLWWVRKAIVELHTTPWFTTFLHHPSGVSLLGHTLNPFNGFLGLLLQPFLSLIATHNVIVVFSFVVAGLTAFRLALYVTGSYWGSIVAGYVFTFSEYHFAHAEGHLQLVALEWIPLFILCWLRLVLEPGPGRASPHPWLCCSSRSATTTTCFYCVLAGAIIGAWHVWGVRGALVDYMRRAWRPMAVFGGATLATSGVLLASLLRLNAADPLGGEHQAIAFSLDALALFIPGGHWRFATLTKSYFDRLPGNIHESSVHLGLAAVLLSIYVWAQRARLRPRHPSLYLWFGLMLFFAVMALGPVLHVGGPAIYDGPMPYSALEAVFPSLRLSGVPVRMVVMVTLAASVIVAIGVQALLDRPVVRSGAPVGDDGTRRRPADCRLLAAADPADEAGYSGVRHRPQPLASLRCRPRPAGRPVSGSVLPDHPSTAARRRLRVAAAPQRDSDAAEQV